MKCKKRDFKQVLELNKKKLLKINTQSCTHDLYTDRQEQTENSIEKFS